MNKREAILQAALKLLATQGVHATPMSAIAKEAGTGMGTIYNYFPKKEELINALYVHIKEEERHTFTALEEGKPLKTQFETYYQRAIQFYLDNPRVFQFIEQLQASPIITEESRAIGYEVIAPVLTLLEKGKEARIIKPIPTQELMQFIGGTVLSFMRLQVQEQGAKPASLDNQMRMVWDAIKE
ncbi:MAG: TetR/AcrR family transcriptional regulator [Bacteroidota bacterium]